MKYIILDGNLVTVDIKRNIVQENLKYKMLPVIVHPLHIDLYLHKGFLYEPCIVLNVECRLQIRKFHILISFSETLDF